MRKGFVFGKFLPFHKGHEAMINFALLQCDFLTVLICCSDQEKIPGPIRKQWLEKTFAEKHALETSLYAYSEKELPNTSVSARDVSAVWAAKFKEMLPDYSVVVTSEPYGDFVAEFMHIEHIPFNPDRHLIPIAASRINENLYANWHFLPDSVKPYFSQKIVILGTESVGKTTLTERLAAHFGASYVLEAGRTLIENSNAFTLDDLYLVASAHAKAIEEGTRGQSPLLIVDTDIHITQSYAKFVLGTTLDVSDDVYTLNKAAGYLYLTHDVPHVQDGTRLSQPDRDLLDLSHRETLRQYNIHFEEISGSWEARFGKAVQLIEQIISVYGYPTSFKIAEDRQQR